MSISPGKSFLGKMMCVHACFVCVSLYTDPPSGGLSSSGPVQVQEEGDAGQKAEGADDEPDPIPGNLGGSAIQPPGLAPEKPTFGNVVTKDIEDGSEIRKKYARG